MTNESTARILHLPSSSIAEDDVPKDSWLRRRLFDLHLIAMPNSQPQPPGFYVNWTSLSAIVVIVGAIAGLWYFTWNTAQSQGYEKGKAEAEKIQMQRQIDTASQKADKAKDIALGGQSDQQPEPEKEKKKK